MTLDGMSIALHCAPSLVERIIGVRMRSAAISDFGQDRAGRVALSDFLAHSKALTLGVLKWRLLRPWVC